MTQINNVQRLIQFFGKREPGTEKAAQEEPSILTKGGGVDTVSFSSKGGTEKFQDVFNELSQNVPDRTSTIEEKELAISYIDRMLACDDIPDDLKTYWQNKKEVIEQEIQAIKNEQITHSNSDEKISDVSKEFKKFIDKYFNRFDGSKLNSEDLLEFKLTYYSTYITFCQRALACSDITEEDKNEYIRMMSNAYSDIENWKNSY